MRRMRRNQHQNWLTIIIKPQLLVQKAKWSKTVLNLITAIDGWKTNNKSIKIANNSHSKQPTLRAKTADATTEVKLWAALRWLSLPSLGPYPRSFTSSQSPPLDQRAFSLPTQHWTVFQKKREREKYSARDLGRKEGRGEGRTTPDLGPRCTALRVWSCKDLGNESRDPGTLWWRETILTTSYRLSLVDRHGIFDLGTIGNIREPSRIFPNCFPRWRRLLPKVLASLNFLGFKIWQFINIRAGNIKVFS